MIFLPNKEVHVFICVIIAQLWAVLYFMNWKQNLVPCFYKYAIKWFEMSWRDSHLDTLKTLLSLMTRMQKDYQIMYGLAALGILSWVPLYIMIFFLKVPDAK